jgi:hypothetical protein
MRDPLGLNRRRIRSSLKFPFAAAARALELFRLSRYQREGTTESSCMHVRDVRHVVGTSKVRI